MDLRPLSNVGTPFHFYCCRCGYTGHSSQGYADITGLAYRAFYCAPCVKQLDQEKEDALFLRN